MQIRSREEENQTFFCEIRVGAEAGIPDDCDVFEACLSGFDLWSEKDADKLISLHLATSPPALDEQTGEIVFSIFGGMNVDCDSPECDLHDGAGATIAWMAAGGMAGQLLGGPAGAAAGALFGGLFSKLDISTDYTLRLHVVLICGKSDHLAATRKTFSNELTWDTTTPITLENEGTQRVEVRGDRPGPWRVSLPGIHQISLEVTREKGFLRPDTAMHLLEWDMAVRPVEMTGTGCTVDLDLFFRNWRPRESVFLDRQIDLGLLSEIDLVDELAEDISSHRDAGSASLTLGLTLLQFAQPGIIEQDAKIGGLTWRGGNASAKSNDAVYTTVVPHEISAAAQPLTSDSNSILVAVENCN